MEDHSTPTDKGIAEIEARLAEIEAGILDEISFTSKTFIQTTFPHSSRAGKEITLVNGDTTITMYSRHGLPYGSYPRLLMFWLTRECLRRRDLPAAEARVIPLEGSLGGFMREVGIQRATGGKDGTITNLRKQMKRLFSTHIGVDYKDSAYDRAPLHLDNQVIAENLHTWWDPQDPDQIDFHGSVTLSEGFFKEMAWNAVPLDTGIVRALRRSPLAMDIYSWLSYRLSYNRAITVVTWDQLRGQFGASYPSTKQGQRDFKKKFIAALDKVLDQWPAATVGVTVNGLMLKPGSPSVPRRVQDELRKGDGNGDSPF